VVLFLEDSLQSRRGSGSVEVMVSQGQLWEQSRKSKCRSGVVSGGSLRSSRGSRSVEVMVFLGEAVGAVEEVEVTKWLVSYILLRVFESK